MPAVATVAIDRKPLTTLESYLTRDTEAAHTPNVILVYSHTVFTSEGVRFSAQQWSLVYQQRRFRFFELNARCDLAALIDWSSFIGSHGTGITREFFLIISDMRERVHARGVFWMPPSGMCDHEDVRIWRCMDQGV
jgi:hypothetical protein